MASKREQASRWLKRENEVSREEERECVSRESVFVSTRERESIRKRERVDSRERQRETERQRSGVSLKSLNRVSRVSRKRDDHDDFKCDKHLCSTSSMSAPCASAICDISSLSGRSAEHDWGPSPPMYTKTGDPGPFQNCSLTKYRCPWPSHVSCCENAAKLSFTAPPKNLVVTLPQSLSTRS